MSLPALFKLILYYRYWDFLFRR